MESVSPGARFCPDYGWACVGKGVELPYITRAPNVKFIPVKLIDRLILRHYPSTYPKELSDKPPLVCQFLDSGEATILSGICEQRFRISNLVGTLDPIVNLPEFQVFFDIVQKTYPNIQIPLHPPSQGPPATSAQGGVPASFQMKNPGSLRDPLGNHGWMMVKDAMVPFVGRGEVLLLPLNVLQGAAQLLIDVPVKTIPSIDPEVTALNRLCKTAKMTFVFTKNTALVDLATILAHHSGCPIRQLPRDDPLSGLVPGPETFRGGLQWPIECLVIPPALAAMYNLPPPPPLLPLDKVFPHQQQLLLEHRRRQAEEEEEERSRPGPSGDLSPPLPTPGEIRHPLNDGPSKDVTAEHIREFQARDMMFHSPPLGLTPGTPPLSLQPPYSPTGTGFIPQPELVTILPIECFGKTISCITRGKLKTKYALVEAVCRVFFPEANLVEFVNYLEHDLSVKLHSLKKIEEATFIAFFGIPTEKLCCNLLIKLKDFVDRMSWLKDKFGGSGDDSKSGGGGMGGSSKGGDLTDGDGGRGGVSVAVHQAPCVTVPLAPLQSFPNKRSQPAPATASSRSPPFVPTAADGRVMSDSTDTEASTKEEQLRLAIKRLRYKQEQQQLQQLQQQQQQQLQAQLLRCNQLQVSN